MSIRIMVTLASAAACVYPDYLAKSVAGAIDYCREAGGLTHEDDAAMITGVDSVEVLDTEAARIRKLAEQAGTPAGRHEFLAVQVKGDHHVPFARYPADVNGAEFAHDAAEAACAQVRGPGVSAYVQEVNPPDADAPSMAAVLETGVVLARRVVANWEAGDLAGAVNGLREWADDVESDFPGLDLADDENDDEDDDDETPTPPHAHQWEADAVMIESCTICGVERAEGDDEDEA